MVLLIVGLIYCFQYYAVPYMKKNFYEEVEYDKQDSKFRIKKVRGIFLSYKYWF